MVFVVKLQMDHVFREVVILLLKNIQQMINVIHMYKDVLQMDQDVLIIHYLVVQNIN